MHVLLKKFFFCSFCTPSLLVVRICMNGKYHSFCYGTPKWLWTVDLMSYYLLRSNGFNVCFIYFSQKIGKYLTRSNFHAWSDRRSNISLFFLLTWPVILMIRYLTLLFSSHNVYIVIVTSVADRPVILMMIWSNM